MPAHRRSVRTSTRLAAAGAILAVAIVATPSAAGASGPTIDFEADPFGGVDTLPFHSAGHDEVAFDSAGSLAVHDVALRTIGRSLIVSGTAPNLLTMTFTQPVQAVSLVFGNDAATALGPDDRAVLTGRLADGTVLRSEVTPNANNRPDQTIALSSPVAANCFTQMTYRMTTSRNPNQAFIVDDVTIEPCHEALTTPVDVDVRPGDGANRVVPHARGRIPVGVLSSDGVDATALDPSSLRFGPGEARPVGRIHHRDLDGDGRLDLVMHVAIPDTGIAPGAADVCLTALLGTTTLVGCDSIDTGRDH